MNDHKLSSLIHTPTCFKSASGRCIDLLITNCKHGCFNSKTFETGFSDFHHMVYTQERRRGGARGGKRPSCPLLRGARGAKVPFSWKMIIYFENIKYDPTDIMTWTLSQIVIKIYISHAYHILLMKTRNHFIIKTRRYISSNMYSGFSFDLSVQSTKLGPWLSLHDAESRPK